MQFDVAQYGFQTVSFACVAGGAGEGGVEVKVEKNGVDLIRVGGRTSTYVGFKDIDNDGKLELLVASQSKTGEQGVWKIGDRGFEKTRANRKAKTILLLRLSLSMHHYGWLCC